MNKLSTLYKTFFSFLLILSVSILFNSAFAQEKAPLSRVALTVTQENTNIWISDFPIKTKVMLVDAEDNLLGVVTTNQFGAAFVQIKKSVYSQVTARTLNNDLQVVNTAVVKVISENEPVAASEKHTGDRV